MKAEITASEALSVLVLQVMHTIFTPDCMAIFAFVERYKVELVSILQPGKCLYTTVRELVENSLDSAESISQLPDIDVTM